MKNLLSTLVLIVLCTMTYAQGDDDPITPVEFIDFTAERNGEEIIFRWSTASEKNNKQFMIERSATAFQWGVIGVVAGAGNSSVVTKYEFRYKWAPKSYYKLSQIDFDGTTTQLKLIVVETIEVVQVRYLDIYGNKRLEYDDGVLLRFENGKFAYKVVYIK